MTLPKSHYKRRKAFQEKESEPGGLTLCTKRKECYESKREAQVSIANSAKHGVQLRAYKCKLCRFWHLTSRLEAA